MTSDPRLQTIRELCSFEGRLAGTDAERRAANRLAERLRETGRKAEVEPTYVHPQAPLVYAAHCAIAFIGSLIAVAEPVVGFALVLVAATSFYLDLNTRGYLLRTLFFRRASQNVVSPGPNHGAAADLFLVAHYDAARTGSIFRPKHVARAARARRLLGFPPARLMFWSVALLLPMLGARMAGIESDAVAIAQLPLTLILLVAIFVLVEIQISAVGPAANDNASGVAVALSLARALRDEPTRNLNVSIVLTGGEECGAEGMRAFLRARRKDLDPAATFVVAIDSVGAGNVRWVTADGMAVSFEADRRLLELCEAIALADNDGERRYGAAPLRRGVAGDALAARARGLRATTITCLEPGAQAPAGQHTPDDVPAAVDLDALGQAHDFAMELVRALDRDLARAGAPTAG